MLQFTGRPVGHSYAREVRSQISCLYYQSREVPSRFSKGYVLKAEFHTLAGTIYLQGGRAAGKGFGFRMSGTVEAHGA